MRVRQIVQTLANGVPRPDDLARVARATGLLKLSDLSHIPDPSTRRKNRMHASLRSLPLVACVLFTASCFTQETRSASNPILVAGGDKESGASAQARERRTEVTSGFHTFDVETKRANGDPLVGKAAVWVPEDYSLSDRAFPLVVFLHGYGERGTDGVKQTQQGLGKLLAANPERFVGCLVLLPQCPGDSVWSRNDQAWAKGKPDAEGLIDESLRQTLTDYVVDFDRISLTGLSMGGFATFLYGARRVETFSALVPLCGGGDPQDAQRLARRPVWAIHGTADRTVAIEESRQMVQALRDAGGTVIFSEYAGVGHNCWDRGYADPEVWSFLVDHARAEPRRAGRR